MGLDEAPELLRGLQRVVGIWLVGGLVGGLLPALTIVSPVVMTYFLVFATGARLLESSMMKRPGYSEYAERTSMFFPLPPRKRRSPSADASVS